MCRGGHFFYEKVPATQHCSVEPKWPRNMCICFAFSFGPPPKRGRASEGPEAMCPEPPASWVAYSPSRNTGKVHAGLARSLGVTKRPCPGATGDAQATFNLCVCVCTCYAMCTIMSPYLLFPAMRIHDNCSLLFLSRASLGAPAVAQCDNAAMVTTVVWDGSPRPHQQRRQATMGHHLTSGTAAPDQTSRPQRTPIAMARQARRARRQPSSSCIRRT